MVHMTLCRPRWRWDLGSGAFGDGCSSSCVVICSGYCPRRLQIKGVLKLEIVHLWGMPLSSPEKRLHLITGHFHPLWRKNPDLGQRSPWGLLSDCRKQATLHLSSSSKNRVQRLYNLLSTESPIDGWQLQAWSGANAKVSLFFSAQIIFGKQLGTLGNTIPTTVYRDSPIQTCPVVGPGLLNLCDCDLTENKGTACQPVGMHGPYFDIKCAIPTGPPGSLIASWIKYVLSPFCTPDTMISLWNAKTRKPDSVLGLTGLHRPPGLCRWARWLARNRTQARCGGPQAQTGRWRFLGFCPHSVALLLGLTVHL